VPTDASVWEKGNAETLDRFVKVMASEFRYSPQTVRNVVSSLRWLPGKAWSELEAEDLLATEERMRAHLKPKTVKIRKIHIRVFMRWLAGLRSKRQDHPGIPDSWKGGERSQSGQEGTERGRGARSEGHAGRALP